MAEGKYLTPKEVAERRRRTQQALAMERKRGQGPPYVQDGGRILYPEVDLEHWLADRYVDPRPWNRAQEVSNRMSEQRTTEARLAGCLDAQVWADEFMKLDVSRIDWGLMVGWFANAIETARMAGEAKGRAEIEAERDSLLSAMRYMRALAHQFPHTNTDQTHESVGVADDTDGAWCLGCSVAATIDEVTDIENELFAAYDVAELDARAQQWVDDYENRDLSSADECAT